MVVIFLCVIFFPLSLKLNQEESASKKKQNLLLKNFMSCSNWHLSVTLHTHTAFVGWNGGIKIFSFFHSLFFLSLSIQTWQKLIKKTKISFYDLWSSLSALEWVHLFLVSRISCVFSVTTEQSFTSREMIIMVYDRKWMAFHRIRENSNKSFTGKHTHENS